MNKSKKINKNTYYNLINIIYDIIIYYIINIFIIYIINQSFIKYYKFY